MFMKPLKPIPEFVLPQKDMQAIKVFSSKTVTSDKVAVIDAINELYDANDISEFSGHSLEFSTCVTRNITTIRLHMWKEENSEAFSIRSSTLLGYHNELLLKIAKENAEIQAHNTKVEGYEAWCRLQDSKEIDNA